MSQGDSRSLIDYSAYVVAATRDFVGRGWVFKAINDWLILPNGPRFFLLTGSPGSGKTAIARRLVQIAQGDVTPPEGLAALDRGFLSAIHFCSAIERHSNDPRYFIQSLSDQFMLTLPPTYSEGLVGNQDVAAPAMDVQMQGVAPGPQVVGVKIETFSLSHLPVQEIFDRLIRKPLESLFARGFDRRVVVLVDGLDEVRLYSGMSIVDLLARADSLPTGVRILVTSRPVLWALRPLLPSMPIECSLSSGQGMLHSLEDVRQYALHMLSSYPQVRSRLHPGYPEDEFAHDVAKECGANFFQAAEVVTRWVPITRDFMRELTRPLPELYGLYRNRLAKVWGGNKDLWFREYQPLLGTLAVAREALTEGQLADYLGASPLTVQERLTALREILTADETLPAERRSWSLFHSSFADFLLDRDHAAEFWIDEKDQHARIVTYYLRKLHLG